VKYKKLTVLFIISALLILIFSHPEPYYFGPKSDHFDGKKFFDKDSPNKKFADLIKFFKGKEEFSKPWPNLLATSICKTAEKEVKGDKINITYVNHSTFLIQTQGINILTDPIWSKRASPVSFAGPKRVVNPGIDFKTLPKIDYVLISHNHYDHLDIPTLKALKKHSNPKILTGLGVCYYLNVKKNLALDCRELDWHENFTPENNSKNHLQFIFTPSKHWSKRSLFDTKATLWGAFVIKTAQGNIYFAGDTGYGKHFKEAQAKYGNFIASLISIGAYEPRWFMKDNHLNPADAILAHRDLASKISIAMHFETFKLSYEGYGEAENELGKLLKEQQIKNFIIPTLGQNIAVK
jgi:L-ascorbate metabolism protein UlaG (beta-lactamase superfamily)